MVGSVTIGAMLKLWTADDPLFVVHDGKDEKVVTHFSGSPLSGTSWLKMVSLRTGKTTDTHGSQFGARAKKLGETISAMKMPADVTPVRLVDLVQILKDKEA